MADEDDDSGAGDATPVGVKLGSTRTVLVFPRDGELTTVRTLTCMTTYEDALTGEERVIYGEQAAREYPDEVEYMLRSGLPEDDERAALAETFFAELVENNDVPSDSAVVYAIPTIDNEPGLANLNAVIEASGIGEELVRSYPESLCGAIPAYGDGLEAIDEIFVGVNLGSTNLEAAAYRHGEQLAPFATGAVTGNEVDRMIANYVEEETQGRVNIDTQTAREYKEEHADFDGFEPFTDVIQQPGGGSHEFTIEHAVMDAVDEYDARIRERSDPLCGRAYATVTEFGAGVGSNYGVIPGTASLVLDRRVLPDEDVDDVDREVADALSAVGDHVSWERIQHYAASAVPPDAPLAERFRALSSEAVGAPTEPWGMEAATDMRNLVNDAGMTAITWGPGSLEQAHTVDEYVDLDDARTGYELLRRASRELLD